MEDEKKFTRLGAILVTRGLITKEQLASALKSQAGQPSLKLGKILCDMHVVSADDVTRVVAEQLEIPYLELETVEIDRHATEIVPVEIARRYDLLPLEVDSKRLVVAIGNPLDQEGVDIVRFLTGQRIDVVTGSLSLIREGISRYYASVEEESALTEVLHSMEQQEGGDSVLALGNLARQAPMISLVDHIVTDAVEMRASDVHIRPQEGHVDVLFRVHGTLLPQRSYSRRLLPALVSRLKILGGMDITERRLPQDGRFQVRRHEQPIDFRVSIIPTIRGESVVIRILDPRAGLLSIHDLGLEARDQAHLEGIIQRNQGLFLVTGPTGSGKSTTLYAALQAIKARNVNIISVENPVEYRVDGISQIQVHHDIDFDFARALRHILRHDPDVIMVGEIRDEETLKMAIQSGLTGHLVLSTLHTNDAVSTVGRLLEMGAAPYLVSSVLLGVLAQRLVRTLCPACRHEVEVDPALGESLKLAAGERFLQADGCTRCHMTGYVGRTAVYELLLVTPRIEAAILQRASARSIQEIAEEEGMVPLTRNALQLARAGITSLEEVYRIRIQ
jgi:type IV pilus assembly protein PilB